jgi:hypothetical protein
LSFAIPLSFSSILRLFSPDSALIGIFLATPFLFGERPSCTTASVRVAEELMRQGFADVHALVGGFDAWKRAGCTFEHKRA